MGYRSDVALVVNKKAYSRLMAVAAKSLVATRDIIDAIEDDDYRGEGSILFYWEQEKWYDSFELPQIVNKFIFNECEWNDEDYQYIRLGESIDDVEEHGCYSHGLSLNRSISF